MQQLEVNDIAEGLTVDYENVLSKKTKTTDKKKIESTIRRSIKSVVLTELKSFAQ